MAKKKQIEEANALLAEIELIAKRAQRAKAQEDAMRHQAALNAENPLTNPSVNEQFQASHTEHGTREPIVEPIASSQKPNHTTNHANFSPGEEF